MEFSELIYEKTNGISPFAYEIVDEWLYFCDLKLPGLFRYHFEKRICECVTQFNTKYVNTNFFKIIGYEDELWMLPFLDGKIVCFNIQTQEIFYYNVPESIEEKRIPFIDIIFNAGKALIFPHGNNRYVIKVDLTTRQMEEIELIKNKNGMVLFSGAIRVGSKVYLAESSRNILIVFNLNTDEMNIIDASRYDLNNRTIKVIENRIYFFPWNVKENVILFDFDKEFFTERMYPIESLPQGEECAIIVNDKKIWILANKKRKIYCLSSNFKIESTVSILNFNENKKNMYISGWEVSGRAFWHGHNMAPLIQVKDGIVQIIDVSEGKNILELYIEMINKICDVCCNDFYRLSIGKIVFEKCKN